MNQRYTLKQLYGVAYKWALEKEPELSHDEITARVGVITNYLDLAWKHKNGRAGIDGEGSVPVRT